MSSSGSRRELHKTIVMVTHDVEEAIKVGDIVAVFRPGGHLAQVDTPERLLGAPADDYVEDFIGFDRGIRRLSFFSASGLDLTFDAMLREDTTIDEARRVAERGADPWVLVLDAERRPRGWVAAADLGSRPGDSRLSRCRWRSSATRSARTPTRCAPRWTPRCWPAPSGRSAWMPTAGSWA